MANSNIDNLANKLRNITVGTPKTKSQRAAESAERVRAAKEIAAERASAERKGSWQSAMKNFYAKRGSTAHTGVKKAKSRRTLKKNTAKANPKATSHKHKLKSLRMKAAMNAAKSKKNEATRKRRETAAMRKEANKAAASAAVIEGKTRAQAKALGKNSEMK